MSSTKRKAEGHSRNMGKLRTMKSGSSRTDSERDSGFSGLSFTWFFHSDVFTPTLIIFILLQFHLLIPNCLPPPYHWSCLYFLVPKILNQSSPPSPYRCQHHRPDRFWGLIALGVQERGSAPWISVGGTVLTASCGGGVLLQHVPHYHEKCPPKTGMLEMSL